MGVTVNNESLKDIVNRGWSWLTKYYKSPGFEQRYRKHYDELLNSGYDQMDAISKYEDLPDISKVNLTVSAAPLDSYYLGSFTTSNNGKKANIDLKENDDTYNDAQSTFAHEEGHLVDFYTTKGGGHGGYSDSYNNIFSNHSQRWDMYKDPLLELHAEALGHSKEDLLKNLGTLFPDLYDKYHDQFNSELFAGHYDLLEAMNRLGYYDASLKDNPITEEIVKRFIEENPDYIESNPYTREYKNNPGFLRWAINTIAYNNPGNNTDTDTYYARKGTKLIPKKRFIK